MRFRDVTRERADKLFSKVSNAYRPDSVLGPLLAVALLAGCSGSYEVHVGFDDSTTRARAARVEVAVVESCSMQALGAVAASPVRLVTFSAEGESPTLGDLDAGSYGLYARASDAECNVVAAGCTPVVVDAGGSGTLRVVLSDMNTPLCDPGIQCVSGQCESVGVDGGVDAGPARTYCDQLGSDWGYNYCRDFDVADEPFVFGWDRQLVDDGGELREDSNAVSAPNAFLATVTGPGGGGCVNAYAEANVGALSSPGLRFQLRMGSMDETEPFVGGFVRLRFMDQAGAETCSLVMYQDGTSGGVVELADGVAVNHPFTVRFPRAFEWTLVRMNLNHETQTFDVTLNRDATFSETQTLSPSCSGDVVVSLGVQCGEEIPVGSGEVRLDDLSL